MNCLSGHIHSIQTDGALSAVQLQCKTLLLEVLLVDNPETNHSLKKGTAVDALFKETAVMVAPRQTMVTSLENLLDGVVAKIEEEALLTRLSLTTDVGLIIALVSTARARKMNLQEQSELTILLRANEIMIAPHA